jgi:putative membrane protein
MYTRKKYPLTAMIIWTRWEILKFVIISSVVTILFEIIDLKWMQLPWTPIALIGTAVAFLIGFQSNAAYGRSWEARKIWGAIVNSSRTFTMMIKDMITNEHSTASLSESELYDHKLTVVNRHVAWMTALRYAMRSPKSWEVFLEQRTNREWYEKMSIPERDGRLEDELKPLLSDEEYNLVLSKTNKAAQILSLQSAHIRKLKEEGLIWEFSFLELEHILKDLFDHQGKSERIKNFPYPRQFATLGYDFVKTFIVLLPFGVIPEFSRIGSGLVETYPLIGNYFVWMAIPFTVIVSWVFSTMQRIGTVGENPFEGSANDVPISTIARGIEIDIREMLDQPKESIPGPLEEILDIQM